MAQRSGRFLMMKGVVFAGLLGATALVPCASLAQTGTPEQPPAAAQSSAAPPAAPAAQQGQQASARKPPANICQELVAYMRTPAPPAAPGAAPAAPQAQTQNPQPTPAQQTAVAAPPTSP